MQELMQFLAPLLWVTTLFGSIATALALLGSALKGRIVWNTEKDAPSPFELGKPNPAAGIINGKDPQWLKDSKQLFGSRTPTPEAEQEPEQPPPQEEEEPSEQPKPNSQPEKNSNLIPLPLEEEPKPKKSKEKKKVEPKAQVAKKIEIPLPDTPLEELSDYFEKLKKLREEHPGISFTVKGKLESVEFQEKGTGRRKRQKVVVDESSFTYEIGPEQKEGETEAKAEEDAEELLL